MYSVIPHKSSFKFNCMNFENNYNYNNKSRKKINKITPVLLPHWWSQVV